MLKRGDSMSKFLLPGLLCAFASSAFAVGFGISNTSFHIDFNDGTNSVSDWAYNVDRLQVSGNAGDYSFSGLLRISPVTGYLQSPVNVAESNQVSENGVQQGPFTYDAPLYIDLTEMTITCNAATGVSCGYFDLDFVVGMDIDLPSDPLPVTSTITGTATEDVLFSYSSAIDIFQLGFPVDDYFVSGNVSTPGGAFQKLLFAGSLITTSHNGTGPTNVVFTGDLYSESGLTGGQSLYLPNSFRTVLGQDTAIPEPGTVWMLLGGAAALAWLKRRRQA